MKWLTSNSRLEKAPKPNKWLLVDNEVFQDEDGAIYLVPRNYVSDNYTIPDWLAWLGGNRSKYDPRPAHIHDFGCQYHQLIRITINESELRRLRLLKAHNGKLICEDVPIEYLELVSIEKWEVDCLFKRAMKATGSIPKWVYNLYRGGVFFNLGWLGNHPPYDLNGIYNIEAVGLVADNFLTKENQDGRLCK